MYFCCLLGKRCGFDCSGFYNDEPHCVGLLGDGDEPHWTGLGDADRLYCDSDAQDCDDLHGDGDEAHCVGSYGDGLNFEGLCGDAEAHCVDLYVYETYCGGRHGDKLHCADLHKYGDNVHFWGLHEDGDDLNFGDFPRGAEVCCGGAESNSNYLDCGGLCDEGD